MTAKRPKIIVFGGSGFLGREICRISRSMGHHIISVSRHGRPDSEERWVHGVEWVEADVFEPDTWSDVLEGAEAVIDCIGEASRDTDEAPEGVFTDVAALLAEHLEDAGVDSVVYISCASSLPGVAASYKEDRLRAEQVFAEGDYSASVLRPSMISGGDSAETTARGDLADRIAQSPGRENESDDPRALRRELVAICALRAALEADISGILEIDEIAHLGDAMFIQ